jgi:hypothetical protein
MNADIEKLVGALEGITANLRTNAYPNESAISTGVILRVLQLLGWDIYSPDLVFPQYGAGGWVDFALCFPERKPAVFIEAKQPGKLVGADKQLFDYAFHEGVPFAVLCDGKTWGFYLPGEQGSYEERRVYKLDLMERTPRESAEKLVRYLEFARTKSGEALSDARADHKDQSRRTLSRQIIPKAWKELVEGEDPSVVEKIAAEVEAKCGVRPIVDDVVEFLNGLGVPAAPQPALPTPAAVLPQAPARHRAQQAPNQPPRGYQLNNTFTSCRTAVDVMIGMLSKLASIDPTFAERCHSHEDNVGRVRTYVAPTRAELYPGRDDLEEFSWEFTPGWYVATNLSNNLKAKVIRMALQVAGLTEDLNARFQF